MPTTFEIAHKHVAGWEGWLSDDKDDRGGITMCGISLQFLRDENLDLNKDGTIDKDDVLSVTPEKAAQIFKKFFWDRSDLDSFPPALAIIFYCSSTNCGTRQTNKLLQRALDVNDDGIIGPITKKAIAECDVAATAERFSDERVKFYNSICVTRPTNKKFLKGWLNRVESCRKLARTVL